MPQLIKSYEYFYIINVFFINILVSSDLINPNISHFNDERIESTVLHLDYIPLNKSSFLLNKYFPNHSDDFNVYSSGQKTWNTINTVIKALKDAGFSKEADDLYDKYLPEPLKY